MKKLFGKNEGVFISNINTISKINDANKEFEDYKNKLRLLNEVENLYNYSKPSVAKKLKQV